MAEDPATQELRVALMQLNEQVKPMHEWLEGQLMYFLSQGYTRQEALAMSAAQFVTVFGSAISRQIAEQE